MPAGVWLWTRSWKRPLKDPPSTSEYRASSLLFYSIRRAFFCSPRAQGFPFWDIELHPSLPRCPRPLRGVALLLAGPALPLPGHGEFGSLKAWYQPLLFFYYKITLVLAPRLVSDAPPSLSPMLDARRLLITDRELSQPELHLLWTSLPLPSWFLSGRAFGTDH